MTLEGKQIGFALTGSHCTYEEIWPEVEKLVQLGADVYPIVSPSVAHTDTRFGKAADIVARFEGLTGKKVISTIVEAEPLGPKKLFHCMIIAPCTGNTMAKLANAITDTAPLMAAKAQLRNGRPLVLAISTNDALGLNAKNLGILLSTPNVFFVPFGQDNPGEKPRSLVADMKLICPTIACALQGEQIQPTVIARNLRNVR
ncbi:MAG TPA: dipicolinate synthase subunit B [Firmicutes bacterium]|jgi:dipicolinate synthase subunit B|nr:MAG: dipicolinate synthase subunit B [Peptococcaceae bacterium 1109]HHT72712.1 dipicolinate synthase subunit B [Bacillota bacterium]